jgi:hypothetical protein
MFRQVHDGSVESNFDCLVLTIRTLHSTIRTAVETRDEVRKGTDGSIRLLLRVADSSRCSAMSLKCSIVGHILFKKNVGFCLYRRKMRTCGNDCYKNQHMSCT